MGTQLIAVVLWRVFWYKQDEAGNPIDGPVAGYDICCPGCRRCHAWSREIVHGGLSEDLVQYVLDNLYRYLLGQMKEDSRALARMDDDGAPRAQN